MLILVFVLAGADGTARLISVPKFATTGTAVLVDLVTLDVQPVVFPVSVVSHAEMDDE